MPNEGIATDISEVSLPSLSISPEGESKASSKFDLSVTIAKIEEGLAFDLTYASDLFRPESIECLMDHYQYVLQQLTTHFDQPLSNIQLFDEQQAQALIQKYNPDPIIYDRPATLLAQFETQVQKTPHRIAVVFEDQQLTYQQLETQANQWAHYLSNRGIQPGELVGLMLERSLDMLIAILAIYKCGAAYLPIDPRYPSTRVHYQMKDAQIKHLLTHTPHLDHFDETQNIDLIDMLASQSMAQNQPETRLDITLTPKDLAYVIYTSGSTGQPKGVMMNHDSVVNQGNWAQDFFALNENDAVLQKTTFCFDPSVWEFFWPLSVGGKVVFALPGMEGDSQYLLQAIEKYEISTICFIPPMLSAFLQDIEANRCPSLRQIVCGGEALQKRQLEWCEEKLPHVQVYNIYGPTEAAIHVTCFKIPKDLSPYLTIPLGPPLSNVEILMLDDAGQLVPEGAVGDLCIGGIQLASAY
ncbi:MAG: AMP-binding protein, partial [Bacteroidota bacterium]